MGLLVSTKSPSGGSYYDRGDPANYDWTQATLTLDGAYHTLDLSGILPLGAKSVILRLALSHANPSREIWFKKYGNVNDINVTKSITQVAGQNVMDDVIIACSDDRKIEYLGSANLTISISIGGWWS